MSSIKNNFQVIGNVGSVETVSSSDKKITNFSVAVNYKNGDKEIVTWFQIVAFGSLAEIIEKYTEKGSKVAVKGYMQNNEFLDKNDVKRYQMKFVASEIVLLNSKKSEE